MSRPRRQLARCAALLFALVGATSCSFLADEFVKLDAAGPVATPVTAPSAVTDHP